VLPSDIVNARQDSAIEQTRVARVSGNEIYVHSDIVSKQHVGFQYLPVMRIIDGFEMPITRSQMEF
jgi:hypothetical protein